MRTVLIAGRSIVVRPLTRREVRDLEDMGASFLGFIPKYETAGSAVERTFGMVLTREDQEFLETQPLTASRDVFSAILKETYGSKDEEKNCASTSDGP